MHRYIPVLVLMGIFQVNSVQGELQNPCDFILYCCTDTNHNKVCDKGEPLIKCGDPGCYGSIKNVPNVGSIKNVPSLPTKNATQGTLGPNIIAVKKK